MSKFLKSNKGIVATFILIFLIALLFRAWNLEKRGEGMDELHWIKRGSSFVKKLSDGNFGQATDSFERHPGIPAAFLMGVSMNFLATSNHYEIPNYIVPFKYSLKIMDPLIAARIPIVVIGALTAAFLYLFVLKIWGPTAGITAGILLALDPFHISLSRIAHQDAALAFFFMCSLFCYLLGEVKDRPWLKILAGIFFGFAFLTKIVALLIPLIIFIWKTIIYFNKKDKWKLPFDVLDLIVILIGIAMFFFFYTEMWGDPVLRFIDHLEENFGGKSSSDTHFFMGETTTKTIHSFYLVVICSKMSLIALFGLIASLICGFKYYLKNKKITKNFLFLLVSILVVLVIMSSFGKMKDRYIMPAWPYLIILSSLGIVDALKYVLKKISKKYLVLPTAILIIFVFNLPTLVTFSPYYFVYYNKTTQILAGGINNVPKYLEVWWGEGMRDAAFYLNQKGNISDLSAVASCQSCFEPYFKGKFIRWQGSEWFKRKVEDNRIDYAVLSVRVPQRHSPEGLYSLYKNKEPEKVININGMDVVWIYNLKE